MEGEASLAILPLKFLLYLAAFWFYGWKVVGRKPAPALGWASLAGIARFTAGMLVIPLGAGLLRIHASFWVFIICWVGVRFFLWWFLAKFTYQPKGKSVLVFAGVMTLVNIAIDLAMFGMPTIQELSAPIGT